MSTQVRRLISRIRPHLGFLFGLIIAPIWISVFFYLVKILPPDVPFVFLSALFIAPGILFALAMNRSMREKLKTRMKEYQRYDAAYKIKNSWIIKRYESAKYADCNCIGCRMGKAAARRYLRKNLLKAYCFRCKTKVDIKNPEQVIFHNNREAIRGICSICGTTVFKTGKFYGSTLFKK